MTGNITVQVDFYASIQQVFGLATTRVAVPAPGTVGDILEKITDTASRRERIFDPSGRINRDLTVLKNGRNINFIGGPAAEVRTGDIVAIFPPTFGG